MGVLLLGADYYGTLAAARVYGSRGVHVRMADERRTARGLFSRYVSERLVAPPLSDVPRFLDWLEREGRASGEKLVLYPTNDHLSWLLAAERDRLAEVFSLYHPSEETNFSLLDKKRLHDACHAVSIDVPDTRFEGDGARVLQVARELRYPLLLKPRTQVFMTSGVKGVLVSDASELELELGRFRQLIQFDRALEERHPEVREPLLQEYLPAAETQIFSVSGFRSREGELVVRAAMKVLQRPRKLGIGLCFEAREVEPPIVAQLDALLRHVAYYGAFEAEFIVDGDRRLLIDVNPRFYSQMAFDIARGLDLPMLVYHGARGEQRELELVLDDARQWRGRGNEAYCHRSMLELVLALQGTSGRMAASDVRAWRQWVRQHRSGLTDAVGYAGDPWPSVVDAAQWVEHFARHPRSFVRKFVLNQ